MQLDFTKDIVNINQSNHTDIRDQLLTTRVHFPFFVTCLRVLRLSLRQFAVPRIRTRQIFSSQKACDSRSSRQLAISVSLVSLQLSQQGLCSPARMRNTPSPQCLSYRSRAGAQDTGARTPDLRYQPFVSLLLYASSPLPYRSHFPPDLGRNLPIRISQLRQLINGCPVLQGRYSRHHLSPFFAFTKVEKRVPYLRQPVKVGGDTTLWDF